MIQNTISKDIPYYNDDKYWEYLFRLGEKIHVEERCLNEDERAFSCGAEMHLSDSKSPLGDLGEIIETSSKGKIKTNTKGEEL